MRRPTSRLLTAAVTVVAALAASAVAAAAVGGDPGLPQQWGLNQVGAPSAWADGAVIGAGVPIAVIDTGADLGHEDLRDRIIASVTCVDTGGDPAACKGPGADIEGHGSHVAGIAAASANSVGISGVAPGASIVAIQVFKRDVQGRYTTSGNDVNAGIRWVLRNVAGKGAVNLSLGGNFVVTNVFGGASFADGIEEAWAAGWLPVLASGNEEVLGLGSSNYGALNALVVGATGPKDEVASYSSPTGNAKWALVAPGGDASGECAPATCVLSTYRGGGYALMQGTSQATPHVAGAAALLMGAGLSNRQTVDRLLETANAKVVCGSRCRGRLDVARAAAGLAPAGGRAPAPAPAPAPTQSAPAPAPGGAATTTPGRRPSAGPPPTTAPPAPTTAAPEETTTSMEVPLEPTAVPDGAAGSEVVGPPLPVDELVTVAGGAANGVATDDGGAPAGAVGAAGLAALGVTGWAGWLWRRRPEAFSP